MDKETTASLITDALDKADIEYLVDEDEDGKDIFTTILKSNLEDDAAYVTFGANSDTEIIVCVSPIACCLDFNEEQRAEEACFLLNDCCSSLRFYVGDHQVLVDCGFSPLTPDENVGETAVSIVLLLALVLDKAIDFIEAVLNTDGNVEEIFEEIGIPHTMEGISDKDVENIQYAENGPFGPECAMKLEANHIRHLWTALRIITDSSIDV